jgi:ubiquinone/menaquinone biosynthesis C-methylase UbiE
MQRSFFWDRIAKFYSRQSVADEAAYQKKLQITRDYFQPDFKVLEFGCGTGTTAITHAPYVKNIQAIDISTKMLAIAQGKADAKDVKNITFQHSSIDNFNAPGQTFDAVLGLNILHLLNNRDKAITKVYEMLKPGGVFISSTACLGNTMKFLRVVLKIGRPFGLILKAFSAKQLEDSLTRAGFIIDHHWHPGIEKAVFIVAKKAK